MEYVLITGGTSGIGYELAKTFIKNGFSVIIVSSSIEGLQRTKHKLEFEYDIKILTYQQDLGKIGAAEQLYRRIREDDIKISILVNNAGIGLVGSTERIDLLRDESMLMLNIVNLVTLCKLFIADMYGQGYGKILNVSSTGAFQPGPYTSTYFASKAFVLSFSRAIRYEAKRKGVQVCTLCPGATKTRFFAREGTEAPRGAMTAEEVAKYAYKRLMNNKDVIVPGLTNKIIRWIPVRLRMMVVARMKNQQRKSS
jgi:short-subunit dehydrogenase